MEIGVWLEDGGLEPAAALGDDGLEVGEGGEVPVDNGFVHQRPEVLGRLQLRAVGREEDEADPLGDDQTLRAMPAGVVEHEDDVALTARPGLAGEGGEQRLEEGFREAGREIPHRLAAGRLHEGDHVQPLVAMVPERDRPLADGGPDPAADRLQAEAVLVFGPDLDRPIGMRRLGLRDRRVEPLFRASRCSGVAARGCRGRGAWIDQPIRCSASRRIASFCFSWYSYDACW